MAVIARDRVRPDFLLQHRHLNLATADDILTGFVELLAMLAFRIFICDAPIVGTDPNIVLNTVQVRV